MTEALIRIENLSVSFPMGSWWRRHGHFTALHEVSFEINRGEIFGVMGRNGCGKTTLLRVLAGATKPTSGNITEFSAQPISKALLSLGFGFDRYLTGRENALLSAMLQGHSRENAVSMLDSIRDFSELGEFFEQPVFKYSSGMRSKLGFATAMTIDVDLLLVDETLSVGDAGFRKKAERSMRSRMAKSQAVVFVSHNASQVRQLCKRSIWLEQGTVRSSGPTKSVADQYDSFMKNLNSGQPSIRESNR
jgi:lipopolysaccharide transport system ATP-binding protein